MWPRTSLRRTLLSAGGLVLILACAWAWHTHSGLARAERLAAFELWPEARAELSRYLWLHPRDSAAHLAMAESLVKDDELPTEQSTQQAIAHLRAVSDDSPYAAMARTQEGRIELFLLNRPSRAEKLFAHAHEVNPRAIDPHFMTWKLYDLTGRSHLAEDHFWKVYDATPVGGRGERLREWYLSQFYPATANPLLDRLMGVASEKDRNVARTEGQRFVRFRNSEPDGAVGYAAVARWFQHEGDPKFALRVLNEGLQKTPSIQTDPFFLATHISLLVELGEFERAEPLADRWPEPHQGYEYWVTQALVRQEIRNQFADAVDAFDRALVIWPGQVDWRTLNRKANCLARLRRQDELAALREQIKKVESLTNDDLHRSLRKALSSLEDPAALQPLIEFYERLGRPREADGWKEYVGWLKTDGKGRSSSKS